VAGKETKCKHTYKVSSGKSCIENGNKEIVFYNEGWLLRDAQRKYLYSIDEKFLTLRTKFYIKRMDGSLAATIKRAGLLSLSFYDWKIKIPDEPDMVASKGFMGSTLSIKLEGTQIAKVRNINVSWESYTVDIEPRQNDALILIIISAIATAYYWEYIDLMM